MIFFHKLRTEIFKPNLVDVLCYIITLYPNITKTENFFYVIIESKDRSQAGVQGIDCTLIKGRIFLPWIVTLSFVGVTISPLDNAIKSFARGRKR